MTTFNNTSRPFVKSIIVSLALLLSVSGIIACSDLQDSGITQSEFKQAQAQMSNSSAEDQPLYIIREDTDFDGTHDNEEILSQSNADKVARLKPDYIKKIEVLKEDRALQKYGKAASNGVVILTLIDKEIAFSDLLDEEINVAKSKADAHAPGHDFYVVAEEMPKLKGGLESVQQCVNYPEEAREDAIQGRVIVQFIVNEEGNVEDPRVVRGIGEGADEEALRCVREATFEPGKQRGNPVPVQYSLPVVYKLPQDANQNNSDAVDES